MKRRSADDEINLRSDLHSRDAVVDEIGRNNTFGLTDISFAKRDRNKQRCYIRHWSNPLPEEELAIQVWDIDGVHINNINVSEANQTQILQ